MFVKIFGIKMHVQKLTSINSFKHPLHENKVDFYKRKKKNTMVFFKKEEALFPSDHHLCYVQFFYETISDWFRGAILKAFFFFLFFFFFFFEALWLVSVKNDSRMIEYGKNFLPIANRVPIEQICE